MLLIALAASWILILALVTALCVAASRGDEARPAPARGAEPAEQWPRVTLGEAQLEVVRADPEAAAAVVAAVRARREQAAPAAPVARVHSAAAA
jgi:hypothetical protein